MTWQIRPSCTSTWRGEGGATPLKMALKRIVSEGDYLIMAATRSPFRLWTLGAFKENQTICRCGENIDGALCTASTAETFLLDTDTMWSTDPTQNPAFHDFARVENRLKIIIKSISGLCSLLLKWPVCWNKRSLRWDQGIQLPRQIHCQGKCGLEFSQKRRVTRNSLKTEK